MMKFNLQGTDLDLEIELRKSKRYYDWLNEGKPKELKTIIEFNSDPDSCPVGTVEWTIEKIGNQKPLIPPPCLRKYLGRRYGEFSGSTIPYDIPKTVFVKSIDQIKDKNNGWYRPLQSIDKGNYFWTEKVSISGEFRVFLGRQGEILDIRNYIGFSVWPNLEKVNEIAKEVFGFYKRPITFDVIVTKDNKTILLEIHDYFALGLYGFSDIKKLPFLIWDWYRLCIQ